MPVIAYFFGIYVRMYFDDHAPPHFHVEYQGQVALIEIATGDVLEGSIPVRAHRIVRQWAAERKPELMENWKCAQELEPLFRIKGADNDQHRAGHISRRVSDSARILGRGTRRFRCRGAAQQEWLDGAALARPGRLPRVLHRTWRALLEERFRAWRGFALQKARRVRRLGEAADVRVTTPFRDPARGQHDATLPREGAKVVHFCAMKISQDESDFAQGVGEWSVIYAWVMPEPG